MSVRGSRAWRAADVFMLLVFAFSVIVQLNDPDPIRWMAVYGLAAMACAQSLADRVRWWFPALVAGVAVAWLVTIAPRVLGRVPFIDMFGSFEMRDVGIEEAREMYGLVIVAAWMATVAARARRVTGTRAA